MRRLRRLLLAGPIALALLLSTTGAAEAHTGGSKASAMSLKETVDQSGHFGVTIKVWNFTSAPRRARVAVELSGSGIGTATQSTWIPGTPAHWGWCNSSSTGYDPQCYWVEETPGHYETTTATSFFERYRTVWVTLKVPAYGTNRKRVYGSFADWPSQVEDPFVWGDVVHVHRVTQ